MLSVPLDEVVTPGLVMKVEGEGLPLTAQGGHLKVIMRGLAWWELPSIMGYEEHVEQAAGWESCSC